MIEGLKEFITLLEGLKEFITLLFGAGVIGILLQYFLRQRDEAKGRHLQNHSRMVSEVIPNLRKLLDDMELWRRDLNLEIDEIYVMPEADPDQEYWVAMQRDLSAECLGGLDPLICEVQEKFDKLQGHDGDLPKCVTEKIDTYISLEKRVRSSFESLQGRRLQDL